MTARIYKPAKTAMQSGHAKTREWVLDYEPEEPRVVESLMGWTSSGDMKSQLRLQFATKEEAVAYAERHGIPYQVQEAKPRAAPRHVLRRQFRFQPPRRLDPLADPQPIGLGALAGAGAVAAAAAAAARRPARTMTRCLSSAMKRSSGIGWPNRKPWPSRSPC